jgi:hypothetical protein
VIPVHLNYRHNTPPGFINLPMLSLDSHHHHHLPAGTYILMAHFNHRQNITVPTPLFLRPITCIPHSSMEGGTQLIPYQIQRVLTYLSVDTAWIPGKADESTMPMILRHSISSSTSQSSITENSESGRREKSMWPSFAWRPSGLTLVCIGVHVAVVLLHVFFLISWHFGWEQKITFAIGSSSDTASTVVTVSLQSLATVSLAGKSFDDALIPQSIPTSY